METTIFKHKACDSGYIIEQCSSSVCQL